MADRATRRTFLHTLAAGSAMAALPCPAAQSERTKNLSQNRHSQIGRPTDNESPTGSGTGSKSPAAPKSASTDAVRAELLRRAEFHLRQPRLVVDYYRVGRKLAYPLPVPSLSLPEVVVPGIKSYPWATWMLWTLEERVLALGWAAEWLQHGESQRSAAADLQALASWPDYRQYGGPDLSSAHAARILWTACTRWHWPSEGLRRELREACRRHAESVATSSNNRYGSVRNKSDVFGAKSPQALLHNIPLIGTIGAALTAKVSDHPASATLNERVAALFGAILDLRAEGFSEGVGYDGYVLDFVADWLATLSEPERACFLDHASFDQYLEESYRLAAPGALADVAELGDVEPREMPFHLSAQAKLLAFRPNQLRAWLLAGCPLDRLRTDGLAAIGRSGSDPVAKAPSAGALDAHYAAVLRSGWQADDLAVAMSCSRSTMGHLQNDSGTLVIGSGGKWWISDPGYQQYQPGEERDFTVGPTAHNAPVIQGRPIASKRPRRLALESPTADLHYLAVDLTECYPALTGLKRIVRHVWLAGRDLVVVADQSQAEQALPLTYHWHGHPEAAWWIDDNGASLTLDGRQLWIASPQARLAAADLRRLPGSRGQLTAICSLESSGPAVWWVFAWGDQRPELHMEKDGRTLRLMGREFTIRS